MVEKISKVRWFRGITYQIGKAYPVWYVFSDPDFINHYPIRIVKYEEGYFIEEFGYSPVDQICIWSVVMRGMSFKTVGAAKEALLETYKEYL